MLQRPLLSVLVSCSKVNDGVFSTEYGVFYALFTNSSDMKYEVKRFRCKRQNISCR